MAREFDPTRPCRYRDGAKPLAVFVLPIPAEAGETVVSVNKYGGSITHFPDGKVSRFEASEKDLINIPEEVEVERWHVINPATNESIWSYGSKEEAEAFCLGRDWLIVVPLTGSYTR